MDNLFGVEVTWAARFIIAFVVVLVLIAVAAWLVRRFGSGALASVSGRGRQPRLAVIDIAAVDARRKLILVRRDNVEHLLMIGGPSDVVIEPNIVRATAAARDVPAARVAPVPEAMQRPVPLEEETPWPLQPAPQPQRAAAPGSLHRSADVQPQLADTLATQPPPLAEPAPLIGPAIAPHLEADTTETEHPVEVRPDTTKPRPGDSKAFYETLEQEMASLLGRPTGKK